MSRIANAALKGDWAAVDSILRSDYENESSDIKDLKLPVDVSCLPLQLVDLTLGFDRSNLSDHRIAFI